ncbi:MAG TPA: hypothetical protein VFS43_21855 [Polyangiaceae bacterium]|nr:hypothetical protein [Polyangiaceae bacterium]
MTHPSAPHRRGPTHRAWRAATALAPACALALLAHCSFPEYSFRSNGENETAGGSGGSPAAGRAGAGGGLPAGGAGGGLPSGGAGGAAGAAGGACAGATDGCVTDCEFEVVTASAELFGVVSDGESVFWSECNLQNQTCSMSARSADGQGPVRVVADASQLPQGQLLVNLKQDADSIYGFLLDADQPPGTPPAAILRVPKAGGQGQVLLAAGNGRVFFSYELSDRFVYAFRENDDQPPGTVVRADKGNNNTTTGVVVTNVARSLVGAEGDEAVVVESNGNIARVQPGISTLILDGDANPEPVPFEGVVEGDVYYFLSLGQVRRFGEGELTFLSTNAGNDPFFFQAEADSLYWVNRRGGVGSTAGDIHTVPKAGCADVRKLVEGVSTDALSVRNGVAYWVSDDFTRVLGRRLR